MEKPYDQIKIVRFGENKGEREIQPWEGVIIRRHKNAWMLLFWTAPNRCAVLLTDKPSDYAGRNTSPLVRGVRQKPNTTSSMWAGSEDRPLKKAAFSERRWRWDGGMEAVCLVPGSAWRAHREGTRGEHPDLNVLWGLGKSFAIHYGTSVVGALTAWKQAPGRNMQ